MEDQIRKWDDLYRTQKRAWRGVTNIGSVPFDEGSSVLELGCGNGKTLAALRDAGYRVTGVDFSQEAVNASRSLLGEDTDLRCASVLDLPFEDEYFDGVVMFHVLEHITSEQERQASSEIFRVMKPGSRLMLKSFSPGDMRSEKGERIDSSSVSAVTESFTNTVQRMRSLKYSVISNLNQSGQLWRIPVSAPREAGLRQCF